MSVEFTYSIVEAALAKLHRIADSKRVAFRARLKHLQRMGFPEGVNTGRGKAAVYLPHHALKLAVVLELSQMGLSPDRAKSVFESNADRVQTALTHAIAWVREGRMYPYFIYFDPAALSILGDPGDPDEADQSFHYAGLGQLQESFSDWAEGYFRRLALINVTQVGDELAHYLSEGSGLSHGDVLEAMITDLGDYGKWNYGRHP